MAEIIYVVASHISTTVFLLIWICSVFHLKPCPFEDTAMAVHCAFSLLTISFGLFNAFTPCGHWGRQYV